jgi:dimethylglycine dehydrogenase
VNYYALPGEPRYEEPSFKRSNAWEATRQEVMAVRDSVGINEVQNFGKYRVVGPNARIWLDRIMAGLIPRPGRLSLTPMLAHSGKIIGDFTVSCLSETEFQLTASYGAQGWHSRWFEQNTMEGVSVENISDTRSGFQIAGPNARELLSRVTRSDVGSENFKFMDVRRMTVGMANCIVQRVSYTADLGYEIYTDHMSVRHLWDVLSAAGKDLDLRPFGMRAMMSLRLDKWFGSWGREFSPDYTPAAATAEKAAGPKRRLVSFVVEAADADVVAWEPIWLDGSVVGFCTSGGFSHYAGKSVAQGLLPAEVAQDKRDVEIEILGERRPAQVHLAPLFDGDGARMRG